MYVFGGYSLDSNSRVLSQSNGCTARLDGAEPNGAMETGLVWGYFADLQFYDRQAENRIEFGGVRMATVDATVDVMGVFSCRFPQKL